MLTDQTPYLRGCFPPRGNRSYHQFPLDPGTIISMLVQGALPHAPGTEMYLQIEDYYTQVIEGQVVVRL
jgi:hypothetical protein